MLSAGPRSVRLRGPKFNWVNTSRHCSPGLTWGVSSRQAQRSLASWSTARRTVAMNAVEFPDTSKYQPGDDLPEEYGVVPPNPPKGRRAGVIMHPTSLPGPYGTGEIGKECFEFVDWLVEAGMTCWQVLPLVPPDEEYFSPYSSVDALCGSTFLISIDSLIEDGLIDAEDAPATVPVEDARFQEVREQRKPILQKAARRLLHDSKFSPLRNEMVDFVKLNPWIHDSALFDVLRRTPELEGKLWWEWPENLRFKEQGTIDEQVAKHRDAINEFIALQFIFDKQWKAVKAYANSKGVKLIGDMPIYVGGQSADVWGNAKLFELNERGEPDLVSGVPPDAFSATGQLWGNPLYNWKAHEEDDYKWWAQRLARAFQLYDEARIDHFRGFAGYWAVKADSDTAMVGVWKKGPGNRLFEALRRHLGEVPILAEDLGVITPDVKELRSTIGAPGMVVLQFAWGGGTDNTHLPHNHYENCFCYPATHDNETTVGWWQHARPDERTYIKEYLNTDGRDISYAFIKEGMKSVARTTIVMMQDVLRLDNTARMNSPGKAEGNWAWRIGESGVWDDLQDEATTLRQYAYMTDRLPEAWRRESDALPDDDAPADGQIADGSESLNLDLGLDNEITIRIKNAKRISIN